MSQIVIGVDVDHLVQRSELGVPEGTELRMFEARRQALLVALLELGDSPGSERLGADFVDHRLRPPVEC